MAPTKTNEYSLESAIEAALTDKQVDPLTGRVRETRESYGAGYISGDPKDYDAAHAVDLVQLRHFLQTTQPQVSKALDLEHDSPTRSKFLARLQGQIAKRGIIDVLRKGVRHGAHSVTLLYGTPTPGNERAEKLYAANIFSITRQVHFSQVASRDSVDVVLFINGLPVATMELKNTLTHQTWRDAIEQYKRDRPSRELLFQFGRCMVHFAVDDQQVWMCTELRDKASWFLPLNKGYDDGAGNPPNPDGFKTDYLWKDILQRDSLVNIIENYAQLIEEKDPKTGRKSHKQIFPRYHQLDVVHKLLAAAQQDGPGHRYLIQHSAGSGKSMSIAWVAHQLIGLEREGDPLFDSIIVVTDRRILDKQINTTIRQFMQVGSTVGHADRSRDLRTMITAGKKIIITTVQKFPFILDEIGDLHRNSTFAIIIDEAHSSQGGQTTAKMHAALAKQGAPEDMTGEDAINYLMESRKMLPNASYFAFTATPKNKTLEIFGEAFPQPDDETGHRPFHSYTMKQAIQEGFIMDVLAHYTPVSSYYRLMKTVQDDPEFDSKRARKKLHRYVESHDYAVRQKADIIVEHFHTDVLARNKIGGKARAMVINGSIERAIHMYRAIKAALKARKSPYKAIVAFSGEKEIDGEKLTEASLNGFPTKDIPDNFQEDPYRILVVADKFQTGYDEPLLHTMYVDKMLSSVRAVQTLSRLNRAHPQKHDTFVLDFANDAETIQRAFEPYYRTTILSAETDPNKLHDLKALLDDAQIYTDDQVETLVARYLAGAEREQLDPLLDTCIPAYDELDEDEQVSFKGSAKSFVRTYNFLSAIIPFNNADWERLSIFLNFLIPKLPAPKEDDLSRGILEAIDMDSYRTEVQASIDISLEDKDGEIGPVPVSEGGFTREMELDILSNIIREFNELYGDIGWQDGDRIEKTIFEDIPAQVKADEAYQNAMQNSDKQNARVEFEKALGRIMVGLLADQTELYKQFSDNESFRRYVTNRVFGLTYEGAG